ncbi:MAG: response regulator [Leptospiraceae bacterium]|nr:response regulator [Leptospiraceae bacterium]
MKTIMSVGQCNPDHNALSNFMTRNLECNIIRIDSTEEAIEALRKQSVDLVLVNRKLDVDYTDGTILIERMKKDEALRVIPIMLISNYPDAQEEAIGKGAVRGFGKLEFQSNEVIKRVKETLGLQIEA